MSRPSVHFPRGVDGRTNGVRCLFATCSRTRAVVTIIEIRPHRWGWTVFESPGVEPVFPEKDQAISYAEGRAWFRSGEIRILDASGNVERVIPFSEADRKL